MGSSKGKKRIQTCQKCALWSVFVLAICCLTFIYFKGSMPDSGQVKIGATYMTMNNDFYKTLNAELEKKTNQQGSRLYVRDSELDEEAKPANYLFYQRKG